MRWSPCVAVIFVLLLSCGCLCQPLFSPPSRSANESVSNPTAPAPVQPSPPQPKPPYVRITLNATSGPAPFYPHYTYICSSPQHTALACEFRLDNQTYTQDYGPAPNPFSNFTIPDFYRQTVSQPGNHTLELYAVDDNGLNSSFAVSFTVLSPRPLSAPGWYGCNNLSASPCDLFQTIYCDKITPGDLAVREAAAAAISKHPGPYSVNQLLDIYDYVRANVPYQNVAVNLTWQPYPPSQTLATKSGDCKNQAVLIASMVEAIGGTSRVLLIPGCSHAFSEVYIGNVSTLEAFNQAVFSHYQYSPAVNWHNSSGQIWFIMDTAGGQYPGQTIPECLNSSDAPQTFVLNDCNRPLLLNPPSIGDIEYGPFVLYDKNMVIEPGAWQYFTYHNDAQYTFCRYNLDLASLSNRPFSEYIIPAGDYNSFKNRESYHSYDRQEQVQHATFQLGRSDPGEFNVIVYNKGDSAITVRTLINSTCYK